MFTPTHRQKPTHKAQRRRVCVNTTVLRNDKINENTEGSKNTLGASTSANCTLPTAAIYATLTTSFDCSELESERLLFSAFRFFLKRANLNYVWKCEKDTPAHQHFHILIFASDLSDSFLSELRCLWSRSVSKFCPSANCFFDFRQLDFDDIDTPIRVAHYFAKQTAHEIDGKLFLMSNALQPFKGILELDDRTINDLCRASEVIATYQQQTIDSAQWSVHRSDLAAAHTTSLFAAHLTKLKKYGANAPSS